MSDVGGGGRRMDSFGGRPSPQAAPAPQARPRVRPAGAPMPQPAPARAMPAGGRMAPRPMTPAQQRPMPVGTQQRPQMAARPQRQVAAEAPQPMPDQAPAKRGGWRVVLQFIIGLLVIAGVAAAIVALYIRYYQ